jgi:hypothetical protein
LLFTIHTIIVLKTSLTGHQGLEQSRVKEKTGEEKTLCNPVTWQDPVKNSVATR